MDNSMVITRGAGGWEILKRIEGVKHILKEGD